MREINRAVHDRSRYAKFAARSHITVPQTGGLNTLREIRVLYGARMHDIRSAAHLTRPSDPNKPRFAYDRSGFRFSSGPIMLLREVHLLLRRGGVPFFLASDAHVYTASVSYLQTSSAKISTFIFISYRMRSRVPLDNTFE